MTRSPLFYPMHRADTDAGGAADLQTDIMRFMAILALCLVAIFALVQSIPLIPDAPAPSEAKAAPPPLPAIVAVPEEAPIEETELTKPLRTATAPEPDAPVRLTRPEPASPPPQRDAPTMTEPRVPATPAPSSPARADEGFSLRFESDLALTRLVASGQVGFYALAAGRAQRMTVSESRISFWDASSPNSFHEMERETVPAPVVDALARTGVDTGSIAWGVTLPGKLRRQLDALMRENSGGALVIGADGVLRLEPS